MWTGFGLVPTGIYFVIDAVVPGRRNEVRRRRVHERLGLTPDARRSAGPPSPELTPLEAAYRDGVLGGDLVPHAFEGLTAKDWCLLVIGWLIGSALLGPLLLPVWWLAVSWLE
ncbi:MAG: hypothetical protein FJW86_04425 [Actinobacteria bacterium]|nr:hypothetical protein [Actinomycetota bacterium]